MFGEIQMKYIGIDEIINPIPLFISNICLGFSSIVRIFINIDSSPKAKAPKINNIQTNCISRRLFSGLIKTIAPIKVIATANHFVVLTVSPNNGIAKIIVKIGLINIKAVASETGIRIEVPNNIVIPIHPQKDLLK